jgi:hypothetical protein
MRFLPLIVFVLACLFMFDGRTHESVAQCNPNVTTC